MTYSIAQLARETVPFWFCLRAQPKREHFAAAGLRHQLGIPCLSPRLRFRKLTTRGTIWFVEAMFPGYIFAEFVYGELHRRVKHSPAVASLVHFGDYIPTVDIEVIERIRAAGSDEEIVTLDPDIRVGEAVRITEGAFFGIEAVVTQLLPAKERVRVLLQFLGRTVETEVSARNVLLGKSPRIVVAEEADRQGATPEALGSSASILVAHEQSQ